MVTGTHFPKAVTERGWEVVYHLMRQPVTDQAPNTNTVTLQNAARRRHSLN